MAQIFKKLSSKIDGALLGWIRLQTKGLSVGNYITKIQFIKSGKILTVSYLILVTKATFMLFYLAILYGSRFFEAPLGRNYLDVCSPGPC